MIPVLASTYIVKFYTLPLWNYYLPTVYQLSIRSDLTRVFLGINKLPQKLPLNHVIIINLTGISQYIEHNVFTGEQGRYSTPHQGTLKKMLPTGTFTVQTHSFPGTWLSKSTRNLKVRWLTDNVLFERRIHDVNGYCLLVRRHVLRKSWFLLFTKR